MVIVLIPMSQVKGLKRTQCLTLVLKHMVVNKTLEKNLGPNVKRLIFDKVDCFDLNVKTLEYGIYTIDGTFYEYNDLPIMILCCYMLKTMGFQP